MHHALVNHRKAHVKLDGNVRRQMDRMPHDGMLSWSEKARLDLAQWRIKMPTGDWAMEVGRGPFH